MHEQDDEADNGKEEIEWRILDTQEGNALIISKYAIEGMGYKKTIISV